MIRWVVWLISLLPLWAMYMVSSAVAPVLYYVVRYRRGVVRRNLVESFPEATIGQIRRLERRFYRFFADMVFETIKMTSISSRTISRRMRFTNPEDIAAVLASGRSVSLYLGHLGNWEWISSLPLYFDPKVIAGQVYRRLGNKAVNELMLRNRERMGAVCVEMRDVARRMNEWRDRVSIVGYIADQSPRRHQIYHRAPFMNHNAAVLIGTEKLTKKYGFAAWFVDVRRVARGRYEATFVQLHEQPSELSDYKLTDLYFQHLELAVRRQPEIYLWTHNRFKHCENRD